MKSLLRVAITVCALVVPIRALAVCGDVTGDGKRTANDALAVLRSSVGQPVNLTCADSGPSRLRYYNDFACSSGSSLSQATFNGFTFEADAGEYSSYQAVDLTEISDIEIDICDAQYFFDGPLYLPRNRSITFFLIKGDPDIYQFEGIDDPTFFVFFDEGDPVADAASGTASAPHEMAVVLGGTRPQTD